MWQHAKAAVSAVLVIGAALALAGCSEVLEPVQGLGDALKGLLESLPF
jgi:hypothetical protein